MVNAWVEAFGYACDAIEWFLAMFAVVFRPDAEVKTYPRVGIRRGRLRGFKIMAEFKILTERP